MHERELRGADLCSNQDALPRTLGRVEDSKSVTHVAAELNPGAASNSLHFLFHIQTHSYSYN